MKDRPFVLLSSSQENLNIGRCKVLLCSASASKAGVEPSMTFTEARAVCSQLIWRAYDDKLYKSAQKKLAGELIALSPRIGCAEPGIFFLDAQGLDHLGGEGKLCRDLLKLASRNGFVDGRVGIAGCAFTARIASSSLKKRWTIVPAGQDRDFMAPLPVSLLPLSAESLANLEALGIKTIAQMLALPKVSYEGRFSSDVISAYELASAADPFSPSLPLVEKSFDVFFDIGSALDSLKETLFILKSMLDKLSAELLKEGLSADELTLRFYNDNDLFDERAIKLLRSSVNSRFLLDVVRLSLESKPLKREFTAIRLIVSRFSREAFEQIHTKLGSSRNSEKEVNDNSVLLLMQRLSSRLGETALVKPLASDGHLIENSGFWQPVLSRALPSEFLPVDSAYVDKCLGTPGKDNLMPGLVLKRHVPAMPVFVSSVKGDSDSALSASHSVPTAVTYKGQWYQISRVTMPERISGLWWEVPVRKSYYVALLDKLSRRKPSRSTPDKKSDLPAFMTVLLVFDHQEQSWYVEGVFD